MLYSRWIIIATEIEFNTRISLFLFSPSLAGWRSGCPQRTKVDEPVNKRLPSSVIKWKKIAAIKRNKTCVCVCEDQMLINHSIFLFFAPLLFSSVGSEKRNKFISVLMWTTQDEMGWRMPNRVSTGRQSTRCWICILSSGRGKVLIQVDLFGIGRVDAHESEFDGFERFRVGWARQRERFAAFVCFMNSRVMRAEWKSDEKEENSQ